MAFDFSQLEPLVHQILSAPGTDLSTISAKRVRRELLSLDSSLTPEFVKENKDDIDAVITRVFGQVSAQKEQEGDDTESRSAEDEDDNEEEQDEEEVPKRKKGWEISDAELARKLSSEINGRSRRSTGKNTSRSSANGTPKKGKSRKSAATVDSDDEESGKEGGKKTKSKRKAASGGAAKGGFAKEYILSAPLASLLQVDKLSRPQVVKQLWNYIKENERQNPQNKREIICDDNLRAVFNADKIDMFKMNKVLGQHLHENGE
ncbi:hypothetical protein VNI00_007458 [Paramarasmius palmivorus]|uniref:DM2 domain-containing protein n=1 Tax=Paramarasmius palmivorus TaxID=297713 RepID=A0AAW0D3L3_9AGAR